MNYLSIAYVLDPRFPGGTSSAVANELAVATKIGRVQIYAIESKMFTGRSIAPQLRVAFDRLGLEITWDAPVIKADVAILHNPSFLKFNSSLGRKIVTKSLFVVTHENFLRPGGFESFDVKSCLEMIDSATLALTKTIAPISPFNRECVNNWLSLNPKFRRWRVLDETWFNICDFEMTSPSLSPRDRRGRLSRPGLEKFPSLASLDNCFPNHATDNVILGADIFLNQNLQRSHWHMLPFGSIKVHEFFEMIDFMVYFTSQTWRESFGRVLAEAIAAGKVVISDTATAAPFGGAVVPATPDDVDEIIANFIQNPHIYQKHVHDAQKMLGVFSSETFADMMRRTIPAAKMVPT